MRLPSLDRDTPQALRLFNGFLEGLPELVIELYGRTVVIHHYEEPAQERTNDIHDAVEAINEIIPWVRCIILKSRNHPQPNGRQGRIIQGGDPDRKVCEHGTWYAVDLLLNRDTSFYLDTRNLRHWAISNLKGISVLNTFAYTGSLGVAAVSGGAKRVVQIDLNHKFLEIAKASYRLNGFPIDEQDFLVGDFFAQSSWMRREGIQFDCVFLDPPFFAKIRGGSIDLEKDSKRLIDKVRPLTKDGGWLVVVNNAVYLSGREFINALDHICQDGYVSIEELIPVPDDCCGYPSTRVSDHLIDPNPFNHSTKIAILRVRRKG